MAEQTATEAVTLFTLETLGEGLQDLRAEVTDVAGNQTDATVVVTVDRQGPSVSVEGIGENSEITDETRLQGAVADSGSDVVSLHYQFEGFNAVEVSLDADGQFDWPIPIGLAGLEAGPQTLTLMATDVAGNDTTVSYSVLVVLDGNEDQTPPALTADLAVDSGSSNSDGITNQVTISGSVSDDESGVSSLRAGFVGMDAAEFVEIGGEVGADGTFTLSPEQLASIYGQALVDGDYTLVLLAVDGAGNTTEQEIALHARYCCSRGGGGRSVGGWSTY